LLKVNHRSISKNSPNLVTLILSEPELNILYLEKCLFNHVLQTNLRFS
jgi:hypothetical protein